MGIKKIYFFGCDLDNSKSDYYEDISLTQEQKSWNSTLYNEQLSYLTWFYVIGKKYGVELTSCSAGSKINDIIGYTDYRYVISQLEKDLPETPELKHALDTRV